MVRFRGMKFSVFLVLFLLGRPLLQSEEKLVEIKFYISRTAVHPGEEFKVALRIKIKKGWHINANQVENELLIPTSFSFEGSPGLQAVESFYPEPQRGRFEYSETDLSYYEGEVLFGARVKTGEDLPLGKIELSGKFRYQACDDRSCRPPMTISFPVSFEIVPSAKETQDSHPEIFAQIEFTKKEGDRLEE